MNIPRGFLQEGTMKLSSYDETLVRLTLKDGVIFEGVCQCFPAEYGDMEYGRNEELLKMDDWLFFKSDIRSVEKIDPKETYIWMNKTEHHMRLNPSPHRMIEEGKKTVELRLYDQKRRKIRVGDLIRFQNTEDETEVLRCEVTELCRFSSFAELYKKLELTECGYTRETLASARPEDMNHYYSPEEQKRFGVVGIRIRLMK